MNERTEAQRTANRALYRAQPDAFSHAYSVAAKRYKLAARQRDQLDVSPFYGEILEALAANDWRRADTAAELGGFTQHLTDARNA